MENTIIQTRTANYLRILFFILAGIVFLAMFVVSGAMFNDIFKCFEYLEYGFWWFLEVAAALAIVGLFQHEYELTVTDHRVAAEKSTGRKKLVLPVNKITAIGYGMFGRISVATPHGSINLLFVRNREKVFWALSDLLNRGYT